VNLIANHMLESLVISWAEENHDFEFLTREAIIHGLIAVALVAKLVQLRAHEVDSLVLKWCCIAFITV
jgi:hypothetical protein